MGEPLPMQEVKRVSQRKSNAHTLLDAQSLSLRPAAFADQIARFVGGGFSLPPCLERIAQFHHVKEIALAQLLTDKIYAQQTGVFVGDRLVSFNAVELALVGIGII